ncbi:MAG TPA: ATP-binding cassette domain-containing protein [Pseudonocardiaceae bacterium]|jgi:fructose transport system ATP-binding protein|nr:ATP-binding cassette domain-containing protein [Pseudonocardiaceae bacterium]
MPNVLQARGLTKRYGHVVAMDNCDFDLRQGEILAVIGDNGAGKSTLIKSLTGAVIPDAGTMRLNGNTVHFRSPLDARNAGIETVYQELGVAPALDLAQNIYLGREQRRRGVLGTVFRQLDKRAMRRGSAQQMADLGIRVQSIRQKVETLSGGQRQAVAVARVAAWARRVVIMDEPTAALGVHETNQVLDLVLRVRDSGLPVVLISHNMPNVFQVADRIHIHRLGRRIALVDPKTTAMEEAVAIMTGATSPEAIEQIDPASPEPKAQTASTPRAKGEQ